MMNHILELLPIGGAVCVGIIVLLTLFDVAKHAAINDRAARESRDSHRRRR